MRVLFSILLLLASSAYAFASVDCKQSDARHEDLGCATEALDYADKKLNETYKALLARMDKEGKGKLKEAQRAWIQFRDADTALAYHNSGEGGSLGDLIAINHKLDLTLDRTKQLKSFADVGSQ